MPEITIPIQYTHELTKLIDTKMSNSSFSYKDWGEKDLEELRVFIRNFYKHAQNGKCAYCRKDVSLTSPYNCHVEHIAPKSIYQKFIFEPKNLCVVCADCNHVKREQETFGIIPNTVSNGKKRLRYPRSSDAFLIVHPHFDNYEEHIEIFGDFLYGDKSPKGAFTISACLLNRRLHVFGWRKELISKATISELMTKFLNSNDTFEQKDLLDKLAQQLVLR